MNKLRKKSLIIFATLTVLGFFLSQAVLILVAKGCEEKPELAIAKTMKNLTAGETPWQELINAKPRQQLAVQIKITNNGKESATNVRVIDELPDRLIYVAGTTKIDSVAAADGIVAAGLDLGTLKPGQTKTVYFEVKAEREVKFVRGTTTLTNWAEAWADNADKVKDEAKVIITYSGCSPEVQMPAKR